MAKNRYTLADLDWMEATLKELKGYIDNNPFSALEDRTEIVMSAKGTPVIKIIATKEAQIKTLMAALKDYYLLVAAADDLRQQREDKDIEIRGGGQINGMMQFKFLNPDEDKDEEDQNPEDPDEPEPIT